MKAVIQRVSSAAVHVRKKTIAQISKGILVLLGIEKGDTSREVTVLADKILKLRIFEDDAGKMNRSVRDINGDILLIPQFTLLADCEKGTRPSFDRAERPELARDLVQSFAKHIENNYRKPKNGVFGEKMDVEIRNDGPVTIILDSKKA